AKAAVGTWVDDRGFLGKTHDEDTGLTHVGAREYDPVLGAFLSVDPLLEPQKHQSLNGYGYAENNPVTLSDPTGMSNQIKCTRGVDRGIDMILADVFVAPPFNPGGGSGSGTSSASSILPPGGLPPSQLQPFQSVPLLLGPDPLPVEYSVD